MALVAAEVALTASAIVGNRLLEFLALVVAVCGILGFTATFCAIPSNLLTGRAAAAGLAVMVSVGNLGGFFWPFAVGGGRQWSGGYQASLLCIAAVMLFGAVLMAAVGDSSAPDAVRIVNKAGARHQAKNGFCTQIGNENFTWFGTRSSKSRLNFLDLLRAGHTDYVLKAAAYDYMRDRGLSAPLIARLAAQPETISLDQAAWSAQLERLGFTALTIAPNPVTIATEGAIWGSIHAHEFLRDTVVLSDDAGQFNIGLHALTWGTSRQLFFASSLFGVGSGPG